MGNPQYTWKEKGGYQAVTPPPPPPPTMSIAPAPIFMVAPAVIVPVMAPPPAGLFFAFSAAGKEVVPAPKSAAAKSVAPKSVAPKSVAAKSEAPKSVAAQSEAPKSVAAKSEAPKSVVAKPDAPKSVASSKSKSSTKSHCNAKATTKPPPALPGMQYIYPKKSTCIHVIKGTKVWEGTDGNFKCRVFNVGTPMTIGELIEHLMGKEGDFCKGWFLTEVVEKGDGIFDKGTSVEYGCDKAGTTLAAIGWTEACGFGRPPVWVVLHKA